MVWGDGAAIAVRMREHLDAGADHVCVQVLTDGGLAGDPGADLHRLAPALTG